MAGGIAARCVTLGSGTLGLPGVQSLKVTLTLPMGRTSVGNVFIRACLCVREGGRVGPPLALCRERLLVLGDPVVRGAELGEADAR